MGKRIGNILLITVLVLTALAAGCGKTGTTTVTDFNNINSTSIKSGNGLSLSVSLDAKTYQSGNAINIVITEYNTLSKTNKRPTADKWPIKGLSDGICGVEDFPFGIAIFQGDYTTNNISTGAPIPIEIPGVIPQGCMPSVFNVTAYNFKPSSDIAKLDGDTLGGSTTFEMSAEIPVWNISPGSHPTIIEHAFAPGVYTVVGGDEWGALVVLHFTITN
jgi:hypothetical protein